MTKQEWRVLKQAVTKARTSARLALDATHELHTLVFAEQVIADGVFLTIVKQSGAVALLHAVDATLDTRYQDCAE